MNKGVLILLMICQGCFGIMKPVGNIQDSNWIVGEWKNVSTGKVAEIKEVHPKLYRYRLESKDYDFVISRLGETLFLNFKLKSNNGIVYIPFYLRKISTTQIVTAQVNEAFLELMRKKGVTVRFDENQFPIVANRLDLNKYFGLHFDEKAHTKNRVTLKKL